MSEERVSPVIPFLRYRDAPGAIAWLVRAFGFKENMVVPGPDGTITHAQLQFGDTGMIMLGSVREDPDVLGMKTPAQAGGVTQGIYVSVDEVDSHYARAAAAGAGIVRPPEDTDYGAREYAARDLEGNLWSFGTYRPKAGSSGAT